MEGSSRDDVHQDVLVMKVIMMWNQVRVELVTGCPLLSWHGHIYNALRAASLAVCGSKTMPALKGIITL
jgi:hypothetical protein